MSETGSAVGATGVSPGERVVRTPGRAVARGKPMVRPPGVAPLAAAHAEGEAALLTARQLLGRVSSRLARCVSSDVDPDEWFPVANRWETARTEAARALALCAACPVRRECLEFSMRHWDGAGRYGVWGGLLEPERAAAHAQWLTGTSVLSLLAGGPTACDGLSEVGI